MGHGDYHPACGRAVGHGIVVPSFDPPSSILGGEAFLSRIYNIYKGMRSQTGANVWNTTLLIGWDEPGGTYDHVPPPAGPTARPIRAGRSARVHVRPLRLPGPGHHRVAVGGRRRGVQRGVPPHLTDRHVAGAVGAGGLRSPQRDAAARTFSRAFTLDKPA